VPEHKDNFPQTQRRFWKGSTTTILVIVGIILTAAAIAKVVPFIVHEFISMMEEED